MLHRLLVMLLCLLLLLPALSTSAQEAPGDTPLLQLLDYVPDTPENREDVIFFTDLNAIAEGYGVEQPASYQDFELLRQAESGDPAYQPMEAWWRLFMNVNMPARLGPYFLVAEGVNAIGFDNFAISRGLSFGRPPSDGLIIQGDFDEDAIRSALTELGFSLAAQESYELWCSDEGCDTGMQQNLVGREPSNPFGGDLGRRQPMIIGDNLLLGSASLEVVETAMAAASGEERSLADTERYQAAVAAVTQEGELIQAAILDYPLLVNFRETSLVPMMFGSQVTPEQFTALLSEMLEDYETLPPYELVLFADTVTAEANVAHVALVYSSQEDAQTAGEILVRRLGNYTSLVSRRPLVEMLSDMRTSIPEPSYYSGVEGKVVLLLSFSTPRPADLETLIAATELRLDDAERPELTPPGLIHRRFIQMIISRDTGWLVTTPREELEALLQEE